jgi:O-antigen ligase
LFLYGYTFFFMLSTKQSAVGVFLFCMLSAISYLHPHHIHPLRTYYHEILIFIGLLLGFAVLAEKPKTRLHFPSLLILPIALLALVLLQMALGIVSSPSDVIIPLAYFVCFAFALVFSATLSAQTGGSQRLCFGLAIMHLLAALLSLVMQQMQMAGVDATPFVMYIARESQPYVRPYANVAQPNQLALLFCLALASLWYLYQSFRLPALASALLALMLLWGLALTQSRIGWIILPLFVGLCWKRTAGERPLNRWLLLVLLLCYVSLALGLPQLGELLGFSSASVIARSGGRSERLVLLQQAWHMAAEHPWLGVGWFGFGAEQVRIAADFNPTTYAEHSHNLLLNFAAELGWPATMAIFSGLAWWWWQTCFQVKASLTVRFATFCLVAVFVHSMVEFPLWYAYVLIPVALLMGMLHQQRWPAIARQVSRMAIMVPVLCFAVLLLLVTFDYQRVVTGFRVLRTPQANTEVGIAALKPTGLTLFSQYFLYFDLIRMTPREGMAAHEIAAVESMSRRFGFVHVLNKLAEVQVLNGQPEKSARTMLTLQKLHPGSYPEYFDYWKSQAALDGRYRVVFLTMPKRDVD